MWVAAQPKRDFYPRQDTRYQASVEGLACRHDGSQVSIHVTDVSCGGCQLASQQDFVVGEIVTLVLAGSGRVRGQIRWSTAGRAGVCFVVDGTETC